MFFILSKILGVLAMPFTWVVGLSLLSLLWRRPRGRRRLRGAALVLMLLFSNAFLYDEAARLWETPMPDSLPRFEHGLVLGGMASYDAEHQRVNFAQGADRLFQALELYHQGVIRKIVLVGGSGSLWQDERPESDFLAEYLRRIHIPEADLLIENQSRNTRENALFAARLLEGQPARPVLLISSANHLPRALACFRAAGLEAVPFPTDRQAGPRKFNFGHLFFPNAKTLFQWNGLLREWVGYLAYAAAGYFD